MTIKIVTLALTDFKKMIATIIAKNNPINKLSVTLFTASFTKVACS